MVPVQKYKKRLECHKEGEEKKTDSLTRGSLSERANTYQLEFGHTDSKEGNVFLPKSNLNGGGGCGDSDGRIIQTKE